MQTGKMKMMLLLQQLELEEDTYIKAFETYELSKLTVHKKHRLWDFQLKGEYPLAGDIFRQFKK